MTAAYILWYNYIIESERKETKMYNESCNQSCKNCYWRVDHIFAEHWTPEPESETIDGLHCYKYRTLFFSTFDGKKCIGWQKPKRNNESFVMEQYMMW